MTSKFYAVAKGRKTGVFKTWKECEESVKNFKGASYKSFTSLQEANNFINSFSKQEDEIDDFSSDKEVKQLVRKDLANNIVSIFVDGSYDKYKKKIGFGILIINGLDKKDWIAISKPISPNNYQKYKDHNNVTGEIFGTIEAIALCLNSKIKKIKIYFDYEGIKKWATNEWNAKTPISIMYSKFMSELKANTDMEVHFQKVKAHSNVEYNEIADLLAKKSIEN